MREGYRVSDAMQLAQPSRRVPGPGTHSDHERISNRRAAYYHAGYDRPILSATLRLCSFCASPGFAFGRGLGYVLVFAIVRRKSFAPQGPKDRFTHNAHHLRHFSFGK